MNAEYRAVNIEQKKERRRIILEAARALFVQSDLNEISMQEVAKKSGLAKGTLFFYFKTKEGLFLALAEQELSKWYESFNKYLLKCKTLGSKDIAAILDLMFQNNSMVVRFFSLMASKLERNIDYKTAYNFKKFLRNNIIKSGSLIEKCIPSFKQGDGAKYLMFFYILIIGIYPTANPGEIVSEVIKEPGMEIFKVDFKQTFIEMMNIFLNGINKL